MTFLYTLLIQLYGAALRLASLFHAKAAALIQGRKEIPQQLASYLQSAKPAQQRVWFHVASVGEFEQALPVYHALLNAHPDLHILFSFYSPSGFHYAQKKYPHLHRVYLPLDTPSAMKDFIQTINPQLVLLVKYEFWFHLVHELKERAVPLVLLSGIFRKQQPFFHPLLGPFFRKMLPCFKHFFVQQEESKTLLMPYVGDCITVSGDTRAERVVANSLAPLHDAVLPAFCDKHPVFIAGSIWASDVPVLQAFLKTLPEDYKMIVAPHEPTHFDSSVFGKDYSLYSAYTPGSRILIMDTLGLLSRAYRVATVAYIGGGFGKGIHNILEAVVYGIPVIFGPKHEKFNEALEMKALGAAIAIHTPEEASMALEALLKNDKKMTEIRHNLANYFEHRANISSQIVVFLERYLHGKTS